MDAVKALDVDGVKKAIAEGQSLKGAIFVLLRKLEANALKDDDEDNYENIRTILDLVLEVIDPNETNKSGSTPLAIIARTQEYDVQVAQERVIDTLIDRGADINVKVEGIPLICLAIMFEHDYLVKKLIHQDQLNYFVTGDQFEFTVLHYVVSYYSIADPFTKKLITHFIEKGVDINAQASNGDTPLHIAARSKDNEMVAFLLTKGANPNIKDLDGKVPIDFFSEDSDNETYKLLESYAKSLSGELPDSAPTAAIVGIAPPPPPPEPKRNARLDKYIPNGFELPGFEIRPFKGLEENIVPVYVTTISRGTLLFRGVHSTNTIYEDVLGIRKPSDSYCLPPHYSVFFYPFPFVDQTVSAYQSVVIYRLVQDIKVACFINPTPMVRADRNIRNMPTTTCETLSSGQFGCSLVGRTYDPCFNHTFLLENPDVVGMIAIAGLDRSSFVKSVLINREFYGYLNKYFSTYTDSHSLYPGIPELALYPRVTRNPNNENTALPPGPRNEVFTKWTLDNMTQLAYIPYHVIPVRSEDAIKSFLDEQIKNKEITIDKSTGFYIYTSDHHIPEHQLPAGEISRMAEAFPELKFRHAQYVTPSFPTSSTLVPATTGGRRTTRRRGKGGLGK